MTFESCSDIAGNSSSGASFDTSALVISNSVRKRSRSRTTCCLARKASTATANSLTTRSRNAISSGFGSNGATELNPNAPRRLSPVVRGSENCGSEPELAPSAAYELRPPSFRLKAWDDQRLLIQPYPAGRILVDRSRARDGFRAPNVPCMTFSWDRKNQPGDGQSRQPG